MADDAIPRRDFLRGAGVAGAAAATALRGRSETAQAQVRAQATGAATGAGGVDAYLTLTAVEAAFLSAAYDTFIPADTLVMGGAAFLQNPGHNPTGTIGALTYWSAKAITEQGRW